VPALCPMFSHMNITSFICMYMHVYISNMPTSTHTCKQILVDTAYSDILNKYSWILPVYRGTLLHSFELIRKKSPFKKKTRP